MIANIIGNVEGFDWDNGNIQKSLLKHKVSFLESEEIFANKPLVILPDVFHSKETEKRFHAFGRTSDTKFILVSFTIRNKKIRVISARPMNTKEREFYANYK